MKKIKQCYWERDEVCVNYKCVCCADFCPLLQDDYQLICKYYEDKEKTDANRL